MLLNPSEEKSSILLTSSLVITDIASIYITGNKKNAAIAARRIF